MVKHKIAFTNKISLVLLMVTICNLSPVMRDSAIATSEFYNRLLESHDALTAQERELQRAYDDVTKKIDDLKQKQDLLDSYLRQTRVSIKDVDRALASVP
jgi:hypothetical protein